MKLQKEKIERLRQFLIFKYGKEIGIKKCGNLMRGSSLKVLVFKYGKENGTRRFDEINNKQKGKGTLNFYIKKYGEVKRYNL